MENDYPSSMEGMTMQTANTDDEICNQSWIRGSDKCNLIINYLPQDINDNTLRVKNIETRMPLFDKFLYA